MEKKSQHETVIPTGGCHDCGGRCVLKAHVREGAIIRFETDDGEEPQYRACARGRAYRQRLYAPDRLKTPLKRVGERGEGKFEPISWEEALNLVAGELKRVKETYGPQAILFWALSGSPACLHRGEAMQRLLYMFGGCTTYWGGASAEGSVFANRATYGTVDTGHLKDDLIYSRLILLWGWNPAVSIQGTNSAYYLAQAKEAGARVIAIDPRFSDTAAILSHQWIPIRPGTDAALAIAMAYVMIAENRHDQRFLDTYTVGFDEFKDYVLGREDGTPKSPAWAEEITGVPAATIAALAREYATAKPAALIPGYAPGRTAFGEQFHRATATLAAMTGNIGIHGGAAGGFERVSLGNMYSGMIPLGKNPAEAGAPRMSGSLDTSLRSQFRLHSTRLWDAILQGKAGGFPADVKLLYVCCGNPLNQTLNLNKGLQALREVEGFILHEHFITPTAKFADIILPVSTHLERNDMMCGWTSGPYFIKVNKAIEPYYGTKSDYEIACELAPRLGVADYSDKTEDEWIQEIIRMRWDAEYIPDYEEFKRKGIQKINLPEPYISFKEQIEDPENNPFPTPSGKIEIYCQRLADLKRPDIPPIPKYIETWESRKDPLAHKYPLQLITTHHRARMHSIMDNVPWLKELEPQAVWISSEDAQARGIADGDLARVFNDRGEMILPARVTERIIPGVVDIKEGAWYAPDERGVDRGGCPNVFTRDAHSPGGAFPSNTSLVQVEKA